MKIRYLIIAILILVFASCSLFEADKETSSMQGLQIPDNFSFSMEENVNLLIEMANYVGQPISNVTYDIYLVDTDGSHKFLMNTRTNHAGVINETLLLPSYVNKLYITGYMNSAEVAIINGEASYVFSPEGNHRGNGDYSSPTPTRSFSYIPGMTFNPDGVPSPFEQTAIDPTLMTRIGTSLPEHLNLAVSHPQYLASGVQTNFVFLDSTDIWFTFVSEGAGYKNALGYYTYDTASGPPADPSSLDLTIIYPNCSFSDSGGAMVSGMKIYLGKFPGGITMGCFLVQNGWISGGDVNETKQRFYSDKGYNPEALPNNQHSVLLYDVEENAFVMGFEDLVRPGGDNDFNDAVFLADAIPMSNVETINIQPVDDPTDTDGDGVNDPFDKYPNDPERAFNVYYPNQDNFATLVFEDLWPEYGDYDMNDFVLDYQYHVVTNANNEFKDINSQFSLRAVGASYDNGFGLKLPIEASNLNVSDYSLPFGLSFGLTVSPDDNLAVVSVFQHTTNMTGQTQQAPYNTYNNGIYRDPIDFYINLTLINPVPTESLPFSFPFNPFIFQKGNNQHEIHLKNFEPTSFANVALFGSGDDASDPSNALYYLSATGLPWALNMPQSWAYPAEKNSILDTYNHFADWAESGGTLFQDWHLNVPENVDPNLIYQNP